MAAPSLGTSPSSMVLDRADHESSPQIWIFPSSLGFMALVQQRNRAEFVVRQLTIGHKSPADALRAVEPAWRFPDNVCDKPHGLAERLQAYAEGADVEFDDVRVAFDGASQFRRRVLAACRDIPRGETRTYGELALAAGTPRAARAVGTTMSTNRVAIIVPCHRVVRSGGQLGGYTAPTGSTLKRRLLELEKDRGVESNRGPGPAASQVAVLKQDSAIRCAWSPRTG